MWYYPYNGIFGEEKERTLHKNELLNIKAKTTKFPEKKYIYTGEYPHDCDVRNELLDKKQKTLTSHFLKTSSKF